METVAIKFLEISRKRTCDGQASHLFIKNKNYQPVGINYNYKRRLRDELSRSCRDDLVTRLFSGFRVIVFWQINGC